MILFIIFLLVAVFACYCVYKTAEVHELHKMRASFENKKHTIEKILEHHMGDSEFSIEYYRGELEEIEEIQGIIDEHIEMLKNFDVID